MVSWKHFNLKCALGLMKAGERNIKVEPIIHSQIFNSLFERLFLFISLKNFPFRDNSHLFWKQGNVLHLPIVAILLRKKSSWDCKIAIKRKSLTRRENVFVLCCLEVCVGKTGKKIEEWFAKPLAILFTVHFFSSNLHRPFIFH